jgi:hypothetical protein
MQSLKSSIKLLFFSFLAISVVQCKKSDDQERVEKKPKPEWQLSKGNLIEKPLGGLVDSGSGGLRVSSTSTYNCGSSLNGSYYGSGFYSYPPYSLDLSGTPLGSIIKVTVNSYGYF